MQLTRLSEIPWKDIIPPNSAFHPSPSAWEDQVLYFLMLDRFSDGKEDGYLDVAGAKVQGTTPKFDLTRDCGCATADPADAQQWWNAGARWMGGTLQGLKSKIGYLKRMGVTAIWISPPFKQVEFQQSYHGYGIQDFLKIDPHFGSNQDLKDLVKAAHAEGIYVILDVVVNHAGDVFEYETERDPRWNGQPYRVKGFRNAFGQPVFPFPNSGPDSVSPHPNDAVLPIELQDDGVFHCLGNISNWDWDPEYREGDFCGLKDFFQGREEGHDGDYRYAPSKALLCLSEVIKYWIAYADLDGLRVDTVKHMDAGATRYLTSVVHEFAQSIGKENFYMVGEIAGGREFAFHVMETTGLDGALGIADVSARMEGVAKGQDSADSYFKLFSNSGPLGKESHTWFRNTVVTMVGDHDMIGRPKARFCAEREAWRVVVAAVALNALTLGIPCIYYGTEQAFDGEGGDDRALRESMFGGRYGSFESWGRHFFDEGNWIYGGIRDVLALRRSKRALRRGRQYLRQISGDGVHFGKPEKWGDRMDSIVAWSRLFASDPEVLVAINTDRYQSRTAWVTVDADLHGNGGTMKCVFAFDPLLARAGQITPLLPSQVIQRRTCAAIELTLPPGGIAVFEG